MTTKKQAHFEEAFTNGTMLRRYASLKDATLSPAAFLSEINGTLDSDILAGDENNNIIAGHEGDDFLYGDIGDDSLLGGKGADTLFGQSGDDVLQGNNGRDQLQGGYGNDTLDGGLGTNTASWTDVTGENSHVTLSYAADGSGTAFVTRDGFEGEVDYFAHFAFFIGGGNLRDSLNWGGLSEEYSVSASLSQQSFSVFFSGQAAFMGGISYFNNLVGGSGHDFLQGNRAANTLNGGDGNDIIKGGAGDDILAGGRGDDFLQGSRGNDTLLGSSGNDTAVWQDVAVLAAANPASEFSILVRPTDLYGTGYAQILKNNQLMEQDNFRQISSYLGSGGDADIVDWSLVAKGGYQVHANLASGYYEIVTELGQSAITGFAHQFSSIIGGTGNDVLAGTGKNNTLLGGKGNDVLYGYEGSDTLEGGLGDDILWGGNDDHDLASWRDLDYQSSVTVDLSFDWLGYIQGRVQRVIFENGQLNIITELDILYGITDLEGGDGNDILSGNDRSNTLAGGNGNDFIYGHHLNDHDILLGGAGADFIDADLSDEVDGGSGTDILVLYGAGQIRIDTNLGNVYRAGSDELLMTAFNIETWWAGFGTTITEIT